MAVAPVPYIGRGDGDARSRQPRSRAGDDRAFETLFGRYRRPIAATWPAWSATTRARRT